MSEADALFRLLAAAPPRSAEIAKRVALRGMGLPAIATLYGVDEARAQVLVFRALLDVATGGNGRVPDGREATEVAAMVLGSGSSAEGAEVRSLWDRLAQERVALTVMLEKSAVEFAASPDRQRDEWLRRLAIVVVLALTAFFYWREQHKPLPPPQKRPTVAPQTTAP